MKYTEKVRQAIKTLHPDANWLAMDADGEAYTHEGATVEQHCFGMWLCPGGYNVRIPYLDNYHDGDWRESKIDLNKPVEGEE